jgi:hypothetical protein
MLSREETDFQEALSQQMQHKPEGRESMPLLGHPPTPEHLQLIQDKATYWRKVGNEATSSSICSPENWDFRPLALGDAIEVVGTNEDGSPILQGRKG